LLGDKTDIIIIIMLERKMSGKQSLRGSMEKKDTVRLFVAVDMPDEVAQEIARVQNIIKQKKLFEGKFVDPAQVHMTLKFIGEVSTEQVPLIEKALLAIEGEALEAQLSSLDVFTAGDRIKIVFLQIICPRLGYLAQKIEQALLQWRKAEKRPFVSHATIARIKWLKDKERLLGLFQKLLVKPIQFTINSFVLKESEFSSEGPVYVDKMEYKLGI